MKEDAEKYESYLCQLLFSEYLKTVMPRTILVKEVFILMKKGTNHAKYKENKPSYKKNKHALGTYHDQKSAEFTVMPVIGKVVTYCSFIVFYAFY